MPSRLRVPLLAAPPLQRHAPLLRHAKRLAAAVVHTRGDRWASAPPPPPAAGRRAQGRPARESRRGGGQANVRGVRRERCSGLRPARRRLLLRTAWRRGLLPARRGACRVVGLCGPGAVCNPVRWGWRRGVARRELAARTPARRARRCRRPLCTCRRRTSKRRPSSSPRLPVGEVGLRHGLTGSPHASLAVAWPLARRAGARMQRVARGWREVPKPVLRLVPCGGALTIEVRRRCLHPRAYLRVRWLRRQRVRPPRRGARARNLGADLAPHLAHLALLLRHHLLELLLPARRRLRDVLRPLRRLVGGIGPPSDLPLPRLGLGLGPGRCGQALRRRGKGREPTQRGFGGEPTERGFGLGGEPTERGCGGEPALGSGRSRLDLAVLEISISISISPRSRSWSWSRSRSQARLVHLFQLLPCPRCALRRRRRPTRPARAEGPEQ